MYNKEEIVDSLQDDGMIQFLQSFITTILEYHIMDGPYVNKPDLDVLSTYERKISNCILKNSIVFIEETSVLIVISGGCRSIDDFLVMNNQIYLLSNSTALIVSNNINTIVYIDESPQLISNSIDHLNSCRIYINLKFLILSHIKTPLTSNLLSSIHNLEYLSITLSDLKSIPDGLLTNLIKLTQIDFSNNKISNISQNLIESQLSLIGISFEKNELTNIPLGLFQSTNKLAKLNLSHNKISMLDWIGDLRELNYVDLSYNEISIIPRSLSYLTKLKDLILHHNKIDDILSSCLSSLISLEYLHLSWNNITYFSLPKMSKLKYLNISKNKKIRSIVLQDNLESLDTLIISASSNLLIDLDDIHNKARIVSLTFIS